MTTPLFPPIPDRTTELRAKGWSHDCVDLKWHPVTGHREAEGAVCAECGSSHYRWAREAANAT